VTKETNNYGYDSMWQRAMQIAISTTFCNKGMLQGQRSMFNHINREEWKYPQTTMECTIVAYNFVPPGTYH